MAVSLSEFLAFFTDDKLGSGLSLSNEPKIKSYLSTKISTFDSKYYKALKADQDSDTEYNTTVIRALYEQVDNDGKVTILERIPSTRLFYGQALLSRFFLDLNPNVAWPSVSNAKQQEAFEYLLLEKAIALANDPDLTIAPGWERLLTSTKNKILQARVIEGTINERARI